MGSNVKKKELHIDRSVVCFLLVNYIRDLPSLSIRSCLEVTNSQIVVGYLNEADLRDLPKSPRIQFLQLEVPPEFSGNQEFLRGDYQDFNQPEFFRLVALKWKLFLQLFDQGYQHVVYSDADIIWFRDAAEELLITHKEFPGVMALIQSDTDKPAEPRLCMGIFSIVNSEMVKGLINECYVNQIAATDKNYKISDDDVVTTYYTENGMPGWIQQLSQTMYPTGRLINSYGGRKVFPGVNHPKPAIFHANWVVGIDTKYLLMRLARKLITPTKKSDYRLFWVLKYRFTRLFFGLKKNAIIQRRRQLKETRMLYSK